MSVSPLASFPVPPAAGGARLAPRAAVDAAATAAAAAPAAAPPATPAATRAAAPSLADLLTPAEREFFATQAALGPLTYGPRRAADRPPAPLGGRIDARA